MKKTILGIFATGLLVGAMSGCNSQPDPSKNPNFNEKALTDPGAVKMGEVKMGNDTTTQP
jgi:hypothetical protein